MSAERCPRCGEPLPSDANFCPNCGAPVAIPAASERRTVSVVFVDMADSTHLAASLDPERFREVLTAFHGMVTEEAAWLGGVAEGFIGDAVLVVFGIPLARDDDAIRAIRTALEIRSRAGELALELGLREPVRVRIGVRTGQVAVGTALDRSIVIGAEVNLGARLQQAAAPSEILVGESTVQLSREAVAFGEPRRIEAKGFGEDVTAYPVEGLRGRTVDRSRITFVNRRREVSLLGDLFERAAARERAHVVTLLGEPGIGKSRVVTEFLAQLPTGTKVLTGRSSPFEEDVEFWPVAQMLHRELGEDPDAPSTEVEQRLRAAVSEWVDGEEVEAAVRRLSLALGLHDEHGDDTRYQLAEVRQGVLAMLAGLARSGPVVLVFEDLHQADPLLLDLIEQLVKEARRVPLLVVCVARWEFLEDRPNWAGGLPDAVTLWVENLSPEHAARLAMEAGGLDRTEAERVATHAGGNPLFIIEITGMLGHEERQVPPVGPGPTPALLPPTVQAVVAARIDQLSPAARELVRRASVFPRGRFDVEELALIANPTPALLAEAEDEELLLPDEEHEGVWRFRSDVLRDVAYDSLAKRERQRLHLRVADKLSEPASAQRYPRTIAFHVEQAARAALDLDPNDRSVADRAVDALTKAGDAARRRIESRAAVDLYERALALAGPEDGWGVREAWIVGMLGEARYWLGEFESAIGPLTRALEIGGIDPRIRAHASRFLGDIELSIRGDRERAGKLFDDALTAARELEDPWTLARTLLVAGWAPYWRNEMHHARAMFEEALQVARANPEDDTWAEARALTMLAIMISETGDEEESLGLASQALAIAEASGDRFSIGVAKESVGSALRRLWRLEDAEPHLDAAVQAFRELGARWELASALTSRGIASRFAARNEDALRDLREAYRLCRELRERSLITWTASSLAKALVGESDLGAAWQVLEEASGTANREGPGSFDWLLDAEAEILLAEGDRETALERSLELLDYERARSQAKDVAAQVWWIARVFGAEAAGGAQEVERARQMLEELHAQQALHAPDLVPSTA